MPGTTPGKQLSLKIISWSSNHEIINPLKLRVKSVSLKIYNGEVFDWFFILFNRPKREMQGQFDWISERKAIQNRSSA